VKDRFPSTNANPDQYAHSDWQGTVVALSVPGGAVLAGSLATTPRAWGELDNSGRTPLCWQGNHGYWSEYKLARPMHYVRARWYLDGGPGWLSPDPLGFGGGDGNLYRYVGNRPTAEVDPSGLFTCKVTGPHMELVGHPVTKVRKNGSQYSVTAYQVVRHVAKVQCMGPCSERSKSSKHFVFWQYIREIDASKRVYGKD
jgi:RHS repeat-associated protein